MKKPIIIGALHLPFYGRSNPAMTMARLEDYLLANVEVFVKNGLTSFYIQDENHAQGAALAETIATVSALGRLVKREFPSVSLGVIIEAHDGVAPLAIAKACGADFVRIKVFAGAMVKDGGVRGACGIESTHYRTAIGAENVKIFADAHDRTGYPLAPVPIKMVTEWLCNLGADGVILTGMSYEQSLAYLDACRDVVGDRPRLLGGSVTIDNIAEVLRHSDGAVVSSSLMLDDQQEGSLVHWDGEKIARFMAAVDQTVTA